MMDYLFFVEWPHVTILDYILRINPSNSWCDFMKFNLLDVFFSGCEISGHSNMLCVTTKKYSITYLNKILSFIFILKLFLWKFTWIDWLQWVRIEFFESLKLNEICDYALNVNRTGNRLIAPLIQLLIFLIAVHSTYRPFAYIPPCWKKKKVWLKNVL